MPTTSSYTFKILLEGKGAIAEARRIRTELERELSRGFDFRQAQQQMGNVADLSRTTGANMAAVASGLGQATQAGDKLVWDMREADDATRQMVSDLFRSGAGAQRLEQALRGGGQAVEETRQQVKWLGRDLEEVAKMGRMERMGAAMTAAARETYGLRTLAGGLGRLGTGMMTTGAAIVGPSALASKRYIEYTRDVARSTRAMGLAREESLALRQELIRQSEALGMVSPEEMAEGLYQWVTGVGATARSYEELQQIIKDTIPIQEMAYLQGINLATATEFTAGIMGEFGLAVSETERVVDVLDATADRTFATVDTLGESFKMVGPVAHQLGISVEETAATFGILSDANIKGTMAGRAFRQLLLRLSKSTKDQDEVLNKLFERNEALGESWKDLAFTAEGQFVGMARWIDLLSAATENLTAEERAAALAMISTANSLPALIHLVESQIEARQEGINVLRAEEKIMTGVLDEEVEAYARWVEETTGNIMSVTSAHEARARKVEGLTEEEGYQIDQLTRKWDAAMLHLGAAVTEMALPAVEELTRLLGEIAEFVKEHPETAQAAVKTGAILVGLGAFVKAAHAGIRLYADVKMITAAATMYQASTNMLEAAGLQATSGKNVVAGLGGIVGPLTAAAAAIIAINVAGEAAGLPEASHAWVARQAKSYQEYLEMLQALREVGAGGFGELELREPTLSRAQWEAVKAGGDLRDITAETSIEIRRWEYELIDATDEMNNLKKAEREARREAQGLGSDLMQIPEATEAGLAAFTGAELEAIDELESYLRRRNDMIEEHNQDLADMQADFLEKQAEQYQDYMDKRADLERELREVSEEPLWRTTKEAQKSAKRQQEAIEEYNKRVEKAIESHQKKLRNLQEDHDDKMEDLEARRDAKGILAERRRYGRAVRDAGEQKDEQLSQQRERLEETLEDEREKIATMREERKADLEDKLKELDETYQKEDAKRQVAFEKEYAERQAKNARDLQQLERSHAERLARIMSWEDRVRAELRQKYAGRETDLRTHLARMQQMYRQSYNLSAQAWITAPLTGIPIPPGLGFGMQAGGYAGPGTYRLGEAGREFVLDASTTRAMERAMGSLSQRKMASLAGAGGYLRMDIRVQADEHFSPAFAKQTEAMVQAEIARLATSITQETQPGAYRPH